MVDKPKPRGKAPCGKDGQPCRWDFLNGCWLEIDGSRHVQRTNADVLKAGRKRVAEAAAAGNERAKRVREAERRRSCEKRRGPSGVFCLGSGSQKVQHFGEIKQKRTTISQQPLVFTRETQRIWNGARCPVPHPLSF